MMAKRRLQVVEPPVVLPREIIERIERVFDYHQSSKHTYQSVRASRPGLDWDNQPSPYRTFGSFPKVELPRVETDDSVPALALLAKGVTAAPPERLHPPQDLRTLAAWLGLANGVTAERKINAATFDLRTCPSSGAAFPFELYVAAFAVDGLEAGLYHYDARDFALRKLRDGTQTFSLLRKGRPDLEFLRTVPAALMVSTIFCRSAWKFRQRGYRYALQDAGHLVQNLITTANALGIQTTTRLRLNDKSSRELIGVRENAPFGSAEAVQAMVVWADQATAPLEGTRGGGDAAGPLAPIPREPLSPKYVPYGSILAVHHDCVAPGVAVREVRPPVTELSLLSPGHRRAPLRAPDALPKGRPIRSVILSRRSAADFQRGPITLDQLWTINRLAFRGGTFFPIFPSGPHVGLVRPCWVVHNVSGIDPGVWYYHPPADKWHVMRHGEFRIESQYISLEQKLCANASAICFILADLRTITTKAGPDSYRLAHLEAGITGQRIHLAAAAMGLGCSGIGGFYDDEVREFLDLEKTGWEPIFELAVGVPVETPPPANTTSAKNNG